MSDDRAELVTLGSLTAEPVTSEINVDAAAQPGETGEPELPRLHAAAQRGDLEAALRWIDAGDDVTEQAEDGSTPLHWAAGSNLLTLCTRLLDAGADPNSDSGVMHATPLHWAARSGFVYVVDLLIERGAEVALADDSGSVCMHLAVQSGNVLLVLYLLHREVDVDPVDTVGGRTPLHWAAYQGDSLSVDCLLRAGASPHAVDKEGFTALHWSLVSRDKDTVRMLIDRGADISARNKDGKNAFDVANDMDSNRELQLAFKATARDKGGQPLKVYFSPESAKIFVFVYPFFWLATSILLFDQLSARAALFFSFALVFGLHSFAKLFIYPTAWPGHNPYVESTLMAGIYNGVFACVVFTSVTWFIPLLYRDHPVLVGLLATSIVAIQTFYVSTATMDPGIVKSGSTSSTLAAIRGLLEAGQFTAKHFSVATSVRLPARARYNRIAGNVIARYDHYCPWAYNAVGVRNHRVFIMYVTTLSLGLVVAGFAYFAALAETHPRLTTWEAMAREAGTTYLFIVSAFMASWIFFLTLVQYVQISRALTSQETIEFANRKFDDEKFVFGSLPPDHPKATRHLPNQSNTKKPVKRNHHHGGGFRTCLNLLGVRQVGIATRALLRKNSNLADHGTLRNIQDFWSGGSMFSPDGGVGVLNGNRVDYYTLWDLPGAAGPVAYEHSDAENALRRLA